MKSFYSISILLFSLINTTQAQAPSWLWSKGVVSAVGGSVKVDVNGNAYVTGAFTNTVSFGDDTLIGIGYGNIFVVKYDPSGNVIWARSAGGPGNGYDAANSICVDAKGNAYIAGSFDGDTLIFGADTLINTGLHNIFIAKYDSSGNLIWAKSAKGPGYDVGCSISTDAMGNAYMTGYFSGSSIVFGTDTITPINTGQFNIIIVKIDSVGNVLWAKNAGTTGFNQGLGISIDASGDSYITGYFTDTIAFNADTLKGHAGSDNIFIAKFDPSGNEIWAKNPNGIGQSNSISTDVSGNAYITGYFENPFMSFGEDTLTNATYYYHSFIAKYDSSGNAVWARSISGTTNNVANAVCTDLNGSAYITGYFNDTTIFFGPDTLINSNSQNIFVCKYDRSGNVIWAQSVGGGTDDSWGIGTDLLGNAYITGGYTVPSIIFGTDTLYTTVGGHSFFLAKLDSSNQNPAGISTINSPDKITIYPNPSNGTFYFSGVQSGSSIEVYNMLGEMVYSGQGNTDIYPVSLSGQAKGIYFYKASNNAGTIQQGKMVLE